MMNYEPGFFDKNRRPKEGQQTEDFSAWDCIKAVSHFAHDYKVKVPEDLTHLSAVGIPLSANQAELYTDLLEANAEGRLTALLDDFLSFVSDGE